MMPAGFGFVPLSGGARVALESRGGRDTGAGNAKPFIRSDLRTSAMVAACHSTPTWSMFMWTSGHVLVDMLPLMSPGELSSSALAPRGDSSWNQAQSSCLHALVPAAIAMHRGAPTAGHGPGLCTAVLQLCTQRQRGYLHAWMFFPVAHTVLLEVAVSVWQCCPTCSEQCAMWPFACTVAGGFRHHCRSSRPDTTRRACNGTI